MSLLQDSTGYYLEPSTGQYYEQAPVPTQSYNPMGFMGGGGYMGMGGFNSQPNYGMGSYSSTPTQPDTTQYLMSDGMRYKPFTGSSDGISAGIRSMVDSSMAGKTPYQYDVPSLAEMFPSSTAPMDGGYGTGGGAGRFLGGLLDAKMPTPVSSETTTAPAASGAGRYL